MLEKKKKKKKHSADDIFKHFSYSSQNIDFDFSDKLSPKGTTCMKCQNRREGNDQESIQLSHTSHQRHQRERNTNAK